jgi:predicted choloylglycine hydrolase
MKLFFRWVREDLPGERWQALCERTWHSYLRWFAKEGVDARPDLSTCRRELERFMPELVPIWERCVELAGGGEVAARLLSFSRPTPFLSGCSQAVWLRGNPFLVRNYDYHPAVFEGVFLRSAWHGTAVVASTDCLWGALDGVNEHGLAVALAFGGRPDVGDGFGIPVILRYVLEFCTNAREATETLCRIPSHMAYNVSVLDRRGEHAVVQMGPGRTPRVVADRVATNHQARVEWPAYDALVRSGQRREYLEHLIADVALAPSDLVDRFLEPPLYSDRFRASFGTLYTAVYHPVERTVDLCWPSIRISQSLDAFEERDLVIGYRSDAAQAPTFPARELL